MTCKEEAVYDDLNRKGDNVLRAFKRVKRLPWMYPGVRRMNDKCTKPHIFKDVDKWLRDTWAVFNGTRTTS